MAFYKGIGQGNNKVDEALLSDTISTVGIKSLTDRLLPLSAFTSDFSAQVRRPKDDIKIPIEISGSKTLINPASYTLNKGASKVIHKSFTLSHVFQPFSMTYEDLMKGDEISRLVKMNMEALGDTLWALATQPLISENKVRAASGTEGQPGYKPAVVARPITANAGFGVTGGLTPARFNPASSDFILPDLWAKVNRVGRKTLVVDPTCYAKLMPVSTQNLTLGSGAYGFDNIFYCNRFPSQTDLLGFIVDPSAIIIASGQPDFSAIQNDLLFSTSVTVDVGGPGMTVYYNLIGDRTTRDLTASIEVMFGATKGLTEAAHLISSDPDGYGLPVTGAYPVSTEGNTPEARLHRNKSIADI